MPTDNLGGPWEVSKYLDSFSSLREYRRFSGYSYLTWTKDVVESEPGIVSGQ